MELTSCILYDDPPKQFLVNKKFLSFCWLPRYSTASLPSLVVSDVGDFAAGQC